MSSSVKLYEGCPVGTEVRNVAYAFWGYELKMGGPAAAQALFYLIGLVILVQLLMARNRNTFYMMVAVTAAWAEGGGYSAATSSVQYNCKRDLFNSFLAAQVIILLVPNLIEATMYSSASKLTAFGRAPRKHFWLRPAFVTWFYAMSDVATILIQAVGVGIWGSAQAGNNYKVRQATVGAWIVVAGLIAQICSQTAFLLQQFYLQIRIEKEFAQRPETRAMYFSVYWIWTFVQIRNIYRLVSFVQRSLGNKSGANRGGGGAGSIQAAFFVLETLMIVISVLLYAIFPPGWLLPKVSSKKIEKEQDQVGTDTEKAGYDVELHARAEIPEYLQRWVLAPFVRYPWLGTIF